jgi:hypothetical protein
MGDLHQTTSSSSYWTLLWQNAVHRLDNQQLQAQRSGQSPATVGCAQHRNYIAWTINNYERNVPASHQQQLAAGCRRRST